MDILNEVKTRLGITGDYQDGLLKGYIQDVKDYLLDAGVDPLVINEKVSIGIIARGVADLWNYGSGEGKLSETFYQRAIQLRYKTPTETLEELVARLVKESTADATVTPETMLKDVTGYNTGEKITGAIETFDGESIIEPTTESKTLLTAKKYIENDIIINPVTKNIDNNIQPENIKLGVEILGVTGNVAPDKPDQEKTITPTEQQQIVTGDTGYELAKVTVEAIPSDYIGSDIQQVSVDVTPTIESQSIVPEENQVFNQINVSPVDSSIDANIQPENIKQGVSILGVEGTVKPATDEWEPNPTWWDIKTILDNSEDIEGLPYKIIYLINDLYDFTYTIARGTTFSDVVKTSDGQTLHLNRYQTRIVWDKSKDKQCYINGRKTYKTRYFIYYTDFMPTYAFFWGDGNDKTPVIWYETNWETSMGEIAPYSAGNTNYLEKIPYKPNNCPAKMSNLICKIPPICYQNGGLSGGNPSASMLDTIYGIEEVGDVLVVGHSSYAVYGSLILNCYSLKRIKSITFDGTRTIISTKMLDNLTRLQEISEPIDFINITQISSGTINWIYYPQSIYYLKLKNIRVSIQIGSGSTWGHLLYVECLLYNIKELWDQSSALQQTFTIGSTNKEKISKLYVKLIPITDEMRAEDPYIDNKKPFEVCESTDEGAMKIEEYARLKNWSIQ